MVLGPGAGRSKADPCPKVPTPYPEEVPNAECVDIPTRPEFVPPDVPKADPVVVPEEVLEVATFVPRPPPSGTVEMLAVDRFKDVELPVNCSIVKIPVGFKLRPKAESGIEEAVDGVPPPPLIPSVPGPILP